MLLTSTEEELATLLDEFACVLEELFAWLLDEDSLLLEEIFPALLDEVFLMLEELETALHEEDEISSYSSLSSVPDTVHATAKTEKAAVRYSLKNFFRFML